MNQNLKSSNLSYKRNLTKDFYLGPMTKNVIDSIIKFNNNNDNFFGVIPSRRQIETILINKGYVNSWTTEAFCSYVQKNSLSSCVILRDHAGPGQGQSIDDGIVSISADISSGIDFLHIDPWKKAKNINHGIELTVEIIKNCESISKNTFYEIGTEEAIFPYSPDELQSIIKSIKASLDEDTFDKIVFGVVQSGTSVTSIENIGVFDAQKSREMSDICHYYGLKAKEHNSDYLTSEEIIQRKSAGVDSLNIAPELGVIETRALIDMMNKPTRDRFFKLCYDSGKWKKWVSKNKPVLDLEKISLICGHYIFSSKEFLDIKRSLDKDVDQILQNEINKKLVELLNI